MNSASYVATVTETAMVAAPQRGVANIRAFRAGAYTRGELFRNHNGIHYMVMASGTYNTEPDHRTGTVNNLMYTPHKKRRALVLQNTGSEPVFVSFGDPVSVASSIRLSAGSSMSLTAIQSGVGAITEPGKTTELRVSEIFV
jgi:hypothetical protein